MVINGAGSMITTVASALFTNLPTNTGTISSTSTPSSILTPPKSSAGPGAGSVKGASADLGAGSVKGASADLGAGSVIGASAGLGAGSVIGVAVPIVIVGLIILVGIAICFLRRRRRSSPGVGLTDAEVHRPLLK